MDNALITALNYTAVMQTYPTKTINDKIKLLHDYLYMHLNAHVYLYSLGMILYANTDAAYLFAEKAKSRITG